jgi:phage terminase large subunit-like protein
MRHDLSLQHLLAMPFARRLAELKVLSEAERFEFSHHWWLFARPEQLAPEGDWRIWLVMTGRGFGKTRAGAEWISAPAAGVTVSAGLPGRASRACACR